MELFVFRHSEWAHLYNCSASDLQVDLVPLEQRRQFSVEAWLIGGLCLIYYTLYFPCLLSIWRHRRDNACYKLLFYIGVMDLSILWLLGFVHAWLSLEGAVFCSRPVLTYWVGLGITSGFIVLIWLKTYLLFAVVLKLKSGTGQNITRPQKMVGPGKALFYWKMDWNGLADLPASVHHLPDQHDDRLPLHDHAVNGAASMADHAGAIRLASAFSMTNMQICLPIPGFTFTASLCFNKLQTSFPLAFSF
jgi:hypothetical protein